MNELPRVSDLDDHQRRAQQVGIEAIERQLFPDETLDVVEIALYINGRLIHTKTNSATVARVMALLTGLAD
jgi:hypothetical protein